MADGVPYYSVRDDAEIKHSKEIKEAFITNGISGVKDYYHRKNDEWKN